MAYRYYLVKKPCYLQVMVSHLVIIAAAAAAVEPVAKQHFVVAANEVFAAVVAVADPAVAVVADEQTIEETEQLSEPQRLYAGLVAGLATELVVELELVVAAAVVDVDVAPVAVLAVN